MADQPNPNDPIETYRRNHPRAESGQRGTMSQLPGVELPPTILPTGQSALGSNIALMQRAMQESRASDFAETTADPRRNLVMRDPRWVAQRQALFEAGADNVRTGAAAGWEEPGFYDTQRPSMAGLQSVGQQQRQGQVDAFMTNQRAGSVQDSRRRR
jgi:hypothetical protein